MPPLARPTSGRAARPEHPRLRRLDAGEQVGHLGIGAEVSAAYAATQLAPESREAWSAYAHSLARTDRISECISACQQALSLGDDPEVADLLRRVKDAEPREISERTAA